MECLELPRFVDYAMCMGADALSGGKQSDEATGAARKLVIGLEGGATKTDWAYLRICDGKTVLVSSGQLPGTNIKLVSEEAIRLLLTHLPNEATHVGAFVAGCVDDHDREKLRGLIAERWPGAVKAVGSDRDSSLATALKDSDGIAVISGTGAAVTGRRGERFEKAGGRGHILGDRGSGYAISIGGLRLALENYDLNHRVTRLTENILRELSLSRVDQIENWFQSADKTSVAKLASLVFAAAEAGDKEMQSVIEAEADTLARYTESVAHRLEFNSPRVKVLGGVFLREPAYVEMYRTAIRKRLPDAVVELCTESGAMGAAWLVTRAQLNQPVDVVARDAESSDAESGDGELATASTEQPNARSADLDSMSLAELVDLFIEEETFVIDALRACRQEIQNAAAAVTRALGLGGRLFYVGAGTSGRLGVLDASEIPPTFGQRSERVQGIIAGGVTALHTSVEGAEDRATEGSLAITERGVRAHDVVMGISASGRTPFVLGALSKAREIGAATVLLSCNPARSRSNPPWDVEIDLTTGPELITGSTRLKAGTATKLVLNIVSTCSMVLLGNVTSNLMVDLRPTNTKLRDRATRLVAELRGLSYEQARARLENRGWSVRQSIASDD
ncbi:MAG TPA: N-acetylmuramic acid 6-phosphate etherase [Blastocatellia bacterium]|nr:N-acetylmuramic acid 6-phosphate etherase [Blastocatellia bacterium]